MGSPAAQLGRYGETRRGLSPSGRVRPYDVVRVVLGLILLTAAALKGHQLATEPVAETSLFTSRWFLIGVVEFELFFGLWLLPGLYPRRTWQAALLCFSAFACVSLYKALSGEATCGCFGSGSCHSVGARGASHAGWFSDHIRVSVRKDRGDSLP